MKLVVGLGNPGRKYEKTRHNVGFALLGEIARQFGAGVAQTRFHGQVAEVAIGGARVLLLEPHTFMNASGRSIRAAVDFYKLDLGSLLVVCDDFNLPLGKLRLRAKGSSGGQRGLENAIHQLGTDEFCRLRIGVGPVPPRWDPAEFVLGRFAADERQIVNTAVAQAVDAVKCWVTEGIDESMNRFN